MAECAGLENRCTFAGTEGSNPSLSAFKPSVGSSESCPRWALFLMARVAASGSDRLWCHEIRVDHPRWSC